LSAAADRRHFNPATASEVPAAGILTREFLLAALDLQTQIVTGAGGKLVRALRSVCARVEVFRVPPPPLLPRSRRRQPAARPASARRPLTRRTHCATSP
jgi:hypothetical protein